MASLVMMDWLHLSWRWLFSLSIIPTLIILCRVQESEVWEATQDRMQLINNRIRNVLRNGAIIRRLIYIWCC